MSDTKLIQSFTGAGGYVWLNGRLLSNVKKIELKVTGEFDDVAFCGNTGTQSDFKGWTGDGTLTMQKIDSEVMTMLASAYKSGVMPDIKIITKLTNPTTGKSERTAVSGVVFTEFMLANFEAKALTEETVPIKFADYEILETL